MASSHRPTGYPQRYHDVVRSTIRGSLRFTAVLLLITGGALALVIYGAAPALLAALPLALLLLFGVLGTIVAINDVRQVRLVPYFVAELGDIETYLSGQALARNLTFLDDLALRGQRRSLSSFGFNDDLCGEELVWHPAAEGLRTVDELLMRVSADSDVVDDGAAVLKDLRKLRHALQRAHDKNVAFCLLLMHGNSTSGHEWSVRKGTAF